MDEREDMDTLHLPHHLELLQRSPRGDSVLVLGFTSDLKIRGSRGKIENPIIILVILDMFDGYCLFKDISNCLSHTRT